MIRIINTFKKVKEEIEINQLPGQAENYFEIKNQLESIKTWLQEHNRDQNIPIMTNLDDLISSFKAVIETKDFRIVKWQSNERDTSSDNEHLNPS